MIKPWVDMWDYLDGNFWRVCVWASQQLMPDEVKWQPIPQVASIGWNLAHLAEMLDYYLAEVFQSQPPLHDRLPTMLTGSRDDGRWHDLRAVADYHRQVRPAYRSFLLGMSADEFSRVRQHTGQRSLTWAWAVGHIAEHESYHLGKCTLLRNLILDRRRGGEH